MNSIIYLLKEEMQLQDQVITFFILIVMDHIKVSNYLTMKNANISK